MLGAIGDLAWPGRVAVELPSAVACVVAVVASVGGVAASASGVACGARYGVVVAVGAVSSYRIANASVFPISSSRGPSPGL